MKRNRIKLNENALRHIIRESLKNIIREQEEEVPYDVYGGIDDYPEEETPEEQWRKLHNAQYYDSDTEQMDKDREAFDKGSGVRPHCVVGDADHKLEFDSLNAFQRKEHPWNYEKGAYGMDALDPERSWARDERVFNGFPHNGNPDRGHTEEDEALPEEYLNESISKAIRRVLKEQNKQ